MRTKFSGYYEPTEKEFSDLWKNCVFVVDTNVLLDFYRMSRETQDTLWEVLELIKERIWVPYQVAKEYHRNILDVIIEQEKKCEDAIAKLENLKKAVVQSFAGSRNFPHIEDELKEKIENVCEELSENIKKERKEIDALINNNPTKEKLSVLLNNKLGEQFPNEKLEEIYTKGRERYEKKVPPGYADNQKKGKGNEIYGDLVIWMEIIQYAKKENKDIIFITSDNKEDWFDKCNGKTIGPRSELRMEFKEETGKMYYAYSLHSFLNYIGKYLNTSKEITSDVIDEVAFVSAEETESVNSVIKEDDIDCIDDTTNNIGEINSGDDESL